MAKSKENNIRKIVLSFYEKDYTTILRCEMLLSKYIKTDTDIPARLIKKYVSFFKRPIKDKKALKNELIEKAKEISTTCIKSIGYDINLSIPVSTKKDSVHIAPPAGVRFIYEGKTKKKIRYTLDFLLNYYFVSLNQLDIDTFFKSMEDLKTFTQVSYKILAECLFYLPKKKTVSRYWYSIIISCIGVGFGFILNENEYDKSKNSGDSYTEFLSRKTYRFCIAKNDVIAPPNRV